MTNPKIQKQFNDDWIKYHEKKNRALGFKTGKEELNQIIKDLEKENDRLRELIDNAD